MTARKPAYHPGRRHVVMGMFGLAVAVLVWRAVDLQLTHQGFLRDHGDARHLRVVATPAHRGMIMDRNGEPLAISTPVESVWAVPRRLGLEPTYLPPLAELLGTSVEHLKAYLQPRYGREFAYLKRHVDPALAERVRALDAPGVFLSREFRRYYPTGEVTAHVLGFTNVDDEGQEGVELSRDDRLRGEPGAKRVIKDRLGHIVENVESIRPARPGADIAISIDKRLQYLAYRELKAAVAANRARGGTVVVLDALTGEVLAMVNQPSFNPNNRSGLKSEMLRNRAVTDVFEPGSTIKPFTIAAALELGIVTPETPIQTGPGNLRVGRHTIKDIHDYGTLDVAHVLSKSSNVGTTKVALALDGQVLWSLFDRVGFGMPSGTGFPGEQSGQLRDYRDWREIEHATMSFGYGLSVTALQLAQAYGIFAREGRIVPATLDRIEAPVEGERVVSPQTARQVLDMLELAVMSGTGQLARVPGYRVGGKTGTVHKAQSGGYAADRYLSLFAGIVPISQPRLVAVVMIDEPRKGDYYGGRVAAPVFGKVMADALRLLDVAPDKVEMPGGQALATLSGEYLEESSWEPAQ